MKLRQVDFEDDEPVKREKDKLLLMERELREDEILKRQNQMEIGQSYLSLKEDAPFSTNVRREIGEVSEGGYSSGSEDMMVQTKSKENVRVSEEEQVAKEKSPQEKSSDEAQAEVSPKEDPAAPKEAEDSDDSLF